MIPRGSRVFTPADLAQCMVEAVGLAGPKSWLEPSYGEGVFLKAIADAGVSKLDVTALELSKRNVRLVKSLAMCFPGTEALGWLRRSDRHFDAVIGNPPYASASDLSIPMRREVGRVINPATGISVGLTANLWLAFLLRSIDRLNEGGTLALVLPASWDYASYAASVKDWLPMQFRSFATFRSDRPLFPEVTEGSVVILGQGFRKPHQLSARYECKDRASTCAAIRRFAVPWPPQAQEVRASVPRRHQAEQVLLSSFLKIRLGGVTGDSKYFVMSEAKRRKLGLPLTSVQPVVTKARHLVTASIDRAKWEALREDQEPVWLFRPTTRALKARAVIEYLKLDQEDGGCNRESGKVKARDPWYQTPLPPHPHAFISGVSDGGVALTFCDMDGLNATNTIYVVTFRPNLSLPQRYAIGAHILSEEFSVQAALVRRRYAGGLLKFEPGDILRQSIPPRLPLVSADEYASAYEKWLGKNGVRVNS